MHSFDYSVSGRIGFAFDPSEGEVRIANVALTYKGAEKKVVTLLQPAPETPELTFDIRVSGIDGSSAVVAWTPSDDTASYVPMVVEKSLFDSYATEVDYIRSDIEYIQGQADLAGKTFAEMLDMFLTTGPTGEQTISGLASDTDYYAYAYGLEPDGFVTTELYVEPFRTEAPSRRECTFEITIEGITATEATVSVIPSDKQITYLGQYITDEQIAQLEAELGTPLFDRVGKTVRLTDAGLTFQDYARTLLATAQQAKAALQPAREVRGTLRIALADSVCSTFLPDLLLHYHARCPEVELVLRTATADEMLQWLSSNEVDLAYTLDQPILQPNLVLAFNELEPICMVAPPNHPLARQEVVTLEELAKQEFLLTERGMSYRDALDQCMDAHHLALKPYIELGSAAMLAEMVERGMGLSFLPEYIVRNELAAHRLARLNVPECQISMHRQLFYHRDKWLTPQMKAFVELV